MITLFVHYKDGNFEPIGHVRRVKVKENYIIVKQDLEPARRIYKQVIDRVRVKSGRSISTISFERG